MALASRLTDGRYLVGAPEAVGPLETLLSRLERRTGPDASILLGLDHPIGVPLAWARQAGVTAPPGAQACPIPVTDGAARVLPIGAPDVPFIAK